MSAAKTENALQEFRVIWGNGVEKLEPPVMLHVII
jgi:hypothetical protein